MADVRSVDTEESRVADVRSTHPQLLGDHEHQLSQALASPDPVAAAREAGRLLWRSQVTAVQAGQLDDRPLYWQRLAAKAAFRRSAPDGAPIAAMLGAFESASRGLDDRAHGGDVDVRVVVTGFDPFGLDRHLDQSNPSGLAALRFDGVRLSIGDQIAEVQTVMVPVRFKDFDDGLIEDTFEFHIREKRIDMLMTVSMGRTDFDLERFPGRRRSATGDDNQRIKTGASAENPIVPMMKDKPLPEPEFVEFSLPVAALQSVTGPFLVNDNRKVATLARGEFEAQNLFELADETAVRGGGGGYLSNEISFRTVRLARRYSSEIPVGHIHTPRMEGYDEDRLRAITLQLDQMIKAAVASLGKD